MSVAIIEQKKIDEFRRRVEAKPFDLQKVQRIREGKEQPCGDDPYYRIFLGDFRVVYSIEGQPDGNQYKHISVSVNEPGKLPAIHAVQEILKCFGFTTDLRKAKRSHIYIEEINEKLQAVNILELHRRGHA